MARFFLSPEAWGEQAVLTGDEAKHASQILRARRGDRLIVFDGLGRSAPAEILDVSRSELRLALGEITNSQRITPSICLAQAVTKGKTMDLIIQKAVELGVSTIQPLITRNTVVQVGEDDASRKSAKWQRVALEACKQCGQDFLPEVLPARTFGEWLPGADGDLKVIASLAPGAIPLRNILKNAGAPQFITLLIGPEGDFSPTEGTSALTAGFKPASLGSIVLRAETAAFFATSAVRYEFSCD